MLTFAIGGASWGEEPFRIGGHIRPPRKTHHVDPLYPEAARRLERQQLVFLDLVIDKEGRVKEVRSLHGSREFTKAAEDAVRQWRYTPFTLDSKPVSAVFAVSMAFVMAGQPQAGLIADALDARNEFVRLLAVEYVQGAPRASFPDLAEVLAELQARTGEGSRTFQASAARAFSELLAREAPIPPPVAPVDALLRQASSPDPALRAEAAWQLTGASGPLDEIRTALQGLTADEDRRVRYAVQWALGQLPPDLQASLPTADKAPPTARRVGPPQYPEEAFRRKEKGTVLVDILIGEEGEVAHATVRLSVPSLDEAALACVRQWQFDPAREAGRPVAFLAHVPVRFNIR